MDGADKRLMIESMARQSKATLQGGAENPKPQREVQVSNRGLMKSKITVR